MNVELRCENLHIAKTRKLITMLQVTMKYGQLLTLTVRHILRV